MALSAPISILKSKARTLKRALGISLCDALNRIAHEEGYSSWSLLVARARARPKRTRGPWEHLNAGDLVLLASRRGHGKTRCAITIALAAMRRGHRSWFFSLENDPPDLAQLFHAAGAEATDLADRFVFDNTAGICAEHILTKVGDSTNERSVIVIDYLQLLDQRRSSPELQHQVEALRAFARRTGCILVFIAQVDRSFDGTERQFPHAHDLRLPNPLDLRLFDKAVFLHDGQSYLGRLTP